jgi:hypothetical protein
MHFERMTRSSRGHSSKRQRVEAGRAARWRNNCARAGATVDGYRFSGFRQADGKTVGDLNDFVNIDYDQWESARAAVEASSLSCPKPLRNALSDATA